jgi:hypothetical protein
LGNPLGVVDVFVSCQTAVHRLPQQVSKGQLSDPSPRVFQALVDEFAEFQLFGHQNQATLGSDPRSLEIDLQESMERKMKGLALFLTD